MNIPLPSRQQAFRLRLHVTSQRPQTLRVHVRDARHPDRYYIRRRVPLAVGARSFSLPFPQSPEALVLELHAEAPQALEVTGTEVEQLAAEALWLEPEMRSFLAFAERLARECLSLGPGVVESPEGDFLVQLLPVITEQGKALQTPARINRKTGRIQLSLRHFARYTVPVRLFILLHERYHYQLRDRSERGPDLAALRLLLALGYPETELVYAATQVFLAHPEALGKSHAKRVKDILTFIKAQKQDA